jgi:hypothetical protein
MKTTKMTKAEDIAATPAKNYPKPTGPKRSDVLKENVSKIYSVSNAGV